MTIPDGRTKSSDYIAQLIDAYALADAEVLDFGAGRGWSALVEGGTVRRLVGVDVDRAVFDNPHLDQAGLLDEKGDIPFSNDEFDVVVCYMVLEHVQDPVKAINEIRRVLRPGGKFLAVTPNLWHYHGIVASATPQSFHNWLVSKVSNRTEKDVFPTMYRVNSIWKIKSIFRRVGFAEVNVRLFEDHPAGVLKINQILYRLGEVYQAVVERFDMMEPFRKTIIVEATK